MEKTFDKTTEMTDAALSKQASKAHGGRIWV